MIIYATEFVMLHLLFYGLYKIMLSKETQLGFLRLFLVGSTSLSLIIPLLEIPTQTNIASLNTETIILPMVTLSENQMEVSWYWILAEIVCVLFALRLFTNLIQIYLWYQRSESDVLNGIAIRKVNGLQNSFTFFRWIFIDPLNFENPGDVLRHELGHSRKWHSFDLLFFYLLTIFFWWVPTIWLMIRELKTVHEFEADDYALNMNDSTYKKTLVHSTLKAHGMNLASSFDDALILNRLNFMNKMKKKVSMWKVASIATLVALCIAMLACEEKSESDGEIGELTEVEVDLPLEIANDSDEAFAEVDESASFPGGLEGWGKFLFENMTYPKQAKKSGVEGRVFVQFVIEKDGSISNVKVLKGIGAGCDAEAKRIVENSPKWVPGKIDGKPVRQKYIQNILFKLSS